MNDKWPEHGKWVIGFRRDLNLYRVCQVNRHERIVVSKLLRTVSDDTFEVDIVPDAFSIDYWIHQYQVLSEADTLEELVTKNFEMFL